MVLTMATKKECDDLGSTKGITGMKNMLRALGGLGSSFSLSKIAVTVKCAAARRLSVEGRRLTSSYKGTMAYTITVPKGSTVSADKVKTTLNSVTDSTWKSSVKSYADAQGVKVTVTALTVTKAGVSNTNDASFAKSTGLMVGMMMMFRALL